METTTEFNIKGMVCNRCISTISEKLSIAGFAIYKISLGKIQLARKADTNQVDMIRSLLTELGFELLSEKNETLLANIKAALLELIEINIHTESTIKISDFLAQKFSKNYDSLAEFFSLNEGTTIEQFYIQQRIEKVKEMLVYTDFSLNEIAHLTGYSSPYHLSGQFKKVTGLTPSYFRTIKK